MNPELTERYRAAITRALAYVDGDLPVIHAASEFLTTGTVTTMVEPGHIPAAGTRERVVTDLEYVLSNLHCCGRHKSWGPLLVSWLDDLEESLSRYESSRTHE